MAYQGNRIPVGVEDESMEGLQEKIEKVIDTQYIEGWKYESAVLTCMPETQYSELSYAAILTFVKATPV